MEIISKRINYNVRISDSRVIKSRISGNSRIASLFMRKALESLSIAFSTDSMLSCNQLQTAI